MQEIVAVRSSPLGEDARDDEDARDTERGGFEPPIGV